MAFLKFIYPWPFFFQQWYVCPYISIFPVHSTVFLGEIMSFSRADRATIGFIVEPLRCDEMYSDLDVDLQFES